MLRIMTRVESTKVGSFFVYGKQNIGLFGFSKTNVNGSRMI